MKKERKTLLKRVAGMAYTTAKKEANSVCYAFFFQPELPEQVKKLRKC